MCIIKGGCSFGCREHLPNEYEEPPGKPLHFDGNGFTAIISLVFDPSQCVYLL